MGSENILLANLIQVKFNLKYFTQKLLLFPDSIKNEWNYEI